MPLPRKVKIGPKTCRVAYKRYDTFMYGEYNTTNNVITINHDLRGAPEEKTTLFHELLHAVMHTHGIHVAAKLSAEQEEIIVRCMEAPLLSLLKDNPELTKWLIKA